jgi:LysM repeat protein
MFVRRRSVYLIVFLLAVSLTLTACVMPFPGSSDDETAAEATPDPNVGGGEPTAPAAESETAPEPSEAESDTPRVTEEATATPEPEAETTEAEAETDEASAEEEATETETTDAEAEAEEAAEEAEAEPAEELPATHTVAAGENLYRIGLKYGISWVTLAEHNNLANANQIKVGQVLNIPGGDTSEPEPTPSPLTETTYTVQAGDNLYRIGLKYGISWTQIAEANGIVNPNQIEVGQALKIPVDTPGPTPQFTHVVKSGETLFLISLRYGVSWTAVAEANDIESPYVIYVGQSIVIPGSE